MKHLTTSSRRFRIPNPRNRGQSFLAIMLTVLVSAALTLAAATPSQAKAFDSYSGNWSGLIGKPKVLGSSPVSVVSMGFIVPVLDCKNAKDGYISIWAGMDSAGSSGGSKPNVTQAGVLGHCVNGTAEWTGFYQAHPDFPSTPMPGMPHLATGQQVYVQVSFEPWTAADNFRASIEAVELGADPDASGTVYEQNFVTNAGAGQRARAECIVERPWVDRVHHLLPKFTQADGSDFTMSHCIGGTPETKTDINGWEIPGVDNAGSNCLVEDMVNIKRNGMAGKKLVDVWVNPMTGNATWHWFAGK